MAAHFSGPQTMPNILATASRGLSTKRLVPGLAAVLCAGALLVAGCGGSETPATGGSAEGAKAPAPAPAVELARADAPGATPRTSAGKPSETATAAPKSDADMNPAEGSAGKAPQAPTNGDAQAHATGDGHDHGQDDAAAGSMLAALPKNARLTVDKTDHDFGPSVEGEVLRHTFKMKSAGEGPLHITSAKPTCGCTVSKIEVEGPDGGRFQYAWGDPIPAGTDFSMTAQLDTKGKHNTASSKINIFCNDPRGTVTVGLAATLDSYFAISPLSLDFGDVSVADKVERNFTVSSKRNQPFKLLPPELTVPKGMAIEGKPVDPDASGRALRWEYTVTLGPGAQEGNIGYPVSLRSDQVVAGAEKNPDGTEPTYGVSVMTTARVRGLINCDPLYISFGLLRPGQVVARTVKLTSYDPSFTFGVPTMRLAGPSDLKPDFAYGEHFSHAARPSDDGKSVEVELTLNGLPETVDGSFQGRWVISTGHPAKPEVAVLFSGVCRAGVATK